MASVDSGTGGQVQLLCNNGFAMTLPALTEFVGSVRGRAHVREYRVEHAEAARVLRGFRLPEGALDLIVIEQGEDAPMLFIVRVGKPCLGGVDMDVYEVLDHATEAARLIAREGLALWSRH